MKKPNHLMLIYVLEYVFINFASVSCSTIPVKNTFNECQISSIEENNDVEEIFRQGKDKRLTEENVDLNDKHNSDNNDDTLTYTVDKINDKIIITVNNDTPNKLDSISEFNKVINDDADNIKEFNVNGKCNKNIDKIYLIGYDDNILELKREIKENGEDIEVLVYFYIYKDEKYQALGYVYTDMKHLLGVLAKHTHYFSFDNQSLKHICSSNNIDVKPLQKQADASSNIAFEANTKQDAILKTENISETDTNEGEYKIYNPNKKTANYYEFILKNENDLCGNDINIDTDKLKSKEQNDNVLYKTADYSNDQVHIKQDTKEKSNCLEDKIEDGHISIYQPKILGTINRIKFDESGGYRTIDPYFIQEKNRKQDRTLTVNESVNNKVKCQNEEGKYPITAGKSKINTIESPLQSFVSKNPLIKSIKSIPKKVIDNLGFVSIVPSDINFIQTETSPECKTDKVEPDKELESKIIPIYYTNVSTIDLNKKDDLLVTSKPNNNQNKICSNNKHLENNQPSTESNIVDYPKYKIEDTPIKKSADVKTIPLDETKNQESLDNFQCDSDINNGLEKIELNNLNVPVTVVPHLYNIISKTPSNTKTYLPWSFNNYGIPCKFKNKNKSHAILENFPSQSELSNREAEDKLNNIEQKSSEKGHNNKIDLQTETSTFVLPKLLSPLSTPYLPTYFNPNLKNMACTFPSLPNFSIKSSVFKPSFDHKPEDQNSPNQVQDDLRISNKNKTPSLENFTTKFNRFPTFQYSVTSPLTKIVSKPEMSSPTQSTSFSEEFPINEYYVPKLTLVNDSQNDTPASVCSNNALTTSSESSEIPIMSSLKSQENELAPSCTEILSKFLPSSQGISTSLSDIPKINLEEENYLPICDVSSAVSTINESVTSTTAVPTLQAELTHQFTEKCTNPMFPPLVNPITKFIVPTISIVNGEENFNPSSKLSDNIPTLNGPITSIISSPTSQVSELTPPCAEIFEKVSPHIIPTTNYNFTNISTDGVSENFTQFSDFSSTLTTSNEIIPTSQEHRLASPCTETFIKPILDPIVISSANSNDPEKQFVNNKEICESTNFPDMSNHNILPTKNLKRPSLYPNFSYFFNPSIKPKPVLQAFSIPKDVSPSTSTIIKNNENLITSIDLPHIVQTLPNQLCFRSKEIKRPHDISLKYSPSSSNLISTTKPFSTSQFISTPKSMFPKITSRPNLLSNVPVSTTLTTQRPKTFKSTKQQPAHYNTLPCSRITITSPTDPKSDLIHSVPDEPLKSNIIKQDLVYNSLLPHYPSSPTHKSLFKDILRPISLLKNKKYLEAQPVIIPTKASLYEPPIINQPNNRHFDVNVHKKGDTFSPNINILPTTSSYPSPDYSSRYTLPQEFTNKFNLKSSPLLSLGNIPITSKDKISHKKQLNDFIPCSSAEKYTPSSLSESGSVLYNPYNPITVSPLVLNPINVFEPLFKPKQSDSFDSLKIIKEPNLLPQESTCFYSSPFYKSEPSSHMTLDTKPIYHPIVCQTKSHPYMDNTYQPLDSLPFSSIFNKSPIINSYRNQNQPDNHFTSKTEENIPMLNVPKESISTNTVNNEPIYPYLNDIPNKINPYYHLPVKSYNDQSKSTKDSFPSIISPLNLKSQSPYSSHPTYFNVLPSSNKNSIFKYLPTSPLRSNNLLQNEIPSQYLSQSYLEDKASDYYPIEPCIRNIVSHPTSTCTPTPITSLPNLSLPTTATDVDSNKSSGSISSLPISVASKFKCNSNKLPISVLSYPSSMETSPAIYQSHISSWPIDSTVKVKPKTLKHPVSNLPISTINTPIVSLPSTSALEFISPNLNNPISTIETIPSTTMSPFSLKLIPGVSASRNKPPKYEIPIRSAMEICTKNSSPSVSSFPATSIPNRSLTSSKTCTSYLTIPSPREVELAPLPIFTKSEIKTLNPQSLIPISSVSPTSETYSSVSLRPASSLSVFPRKQLSSTSYTPSIPTSSDSITPEFDLTDKLATTSRLNGTPYIVNTQPKSTQHKAFYYPQKTLISSKDSPNEFNVQPQFSNIYNKPGIDVISSKNYENYLKPVRQPQSIKPFVKNHQLFETPLTYNSPLKYFEQKQLPTNQVTDTYLPLQSKIKLLTPQSTTDHNLANVKDSDIPIIYRDSLSSNLDSNFLYNDLSYKSKPCFISSKHIPNSKSQYHYPINKSSVQFTKPNLVPQNREKQEFFLPLNQENKHSNSYLPNNYKKYPSFKLLPSKIYTSKHPKNSKLKLNSLSSRNLLSEPFYSKENVLKLSPYTNKLPIEFSNEKTFPPSLLSPCTETQINFDKKYPMNALNQYQPFDQPIQSNFKHIPNTLSSYFKDTDRLTPPSFRLKDNYFNTINNLTPFKKDIYRTDNKVSIPIGNIAIAKYEPNLFEKFNIKTDNPDIELKMWLSRLKIYKAKVIVEVDESSVINFIPIVKNKASYRSDYIRDTVTSVVLIAFALVEAGIQERAPSTATEIHNGHLFTDPRR
ncbi:unnamed protein product [Euphydryas editha]|uniref:Uncharacterized protein n=1 Tax=Euphydryas editha TaxID=104508 RepID=A0AAU9T9E1_EUPED|nr:unnamed protein product [Euphydryas editha]